MVCASRVAGQSVPSRYQPSRKIHCRVLLRSAHKCLLPPAFFLVASLRLSSLPICQRMLTADARTARNAPATQGLARLELQSNTNRLGRARVVGANAPGSCGSKWPHTGTVPSSGRELEEGCSPGRSKIGTSQGQGRCAVVGAPSWKNLGWWAVQGSQWHPLRCLAVARRGDWRAAAGALLASSRSFHRGRFAGECSVLATVGAADPDWRRRRVAGWQKRSINHSREFHHDIGHVLLQNVAGLLCRIPQQVRVWRQQLHRVVLRAVFKPPTLLLFPNCDLHHVHVVVASPFPAAAKKASAARCARNNRELETHRRRETSTSPIDATAA
jgi:hypothetical protein